jgi:hypothetical protein
MIKMSNTSLNLCPADHNGPNLLCSSRLIKKLLFSICLFFFTISFVQAQFRKYSNEFLNIGAGARGLAMGGAQIASVSDATAGYWNPAGLTGIKENPVVSLMHAEYFAGIGKYDYVSAALPIGDPLTSKKVLGISLLRFAVDDIPNTLFLVEPDGSINYNNIRSFSSADYAMLLSYGQVLMEKNSKKLSLGVNAKIIHRSVGSFAKAWGIGMDAALQYHSKLLKLGIVVKDITTTFNAWRFNFSEREKEVLYLTNNEIPIKSTEMTAPRVVLGAAIVRPVSQKLNFQAEMNLDLTFDGRRNVLVSTMPLNVDPRVGFELGYRELIFGRLGVYNFQKGLQDGDSTNSKSVWIYQPSAGVGFKIKNVEVDYAFTNLANQSNPLYTHIFSLKMNLVKKEKK